MTEVRTQKKSRFTYAIEASGYGTQVAAPDYFLMHLLKRDPKDEIAFEPIQALDGDTKDIEDFIQTTESYQFTLTGRPIHGVPFGYIWGDDYSMDLTTYYVHCMQNLISETYDLPSATGEITLVDSTGHTRWYDGLKVMSAELSIEPEKPIELSIDYVAQDSGSSDDTGQSYEGTDTRGKYYAPSTKRPFDFGDARIEILGVDFNPTSAKLRVDNALVLEYLLDDDVGRKIAEPFPARRTYEFELSGRMAADTYFDLWKAGGTKLGKTTGLLLDDGDGINASDATLTFDGTQSPTASIPTRGIIKIEKPAGTDIEYIYYAAHDSTDFTGCVRGICGSTAASHADDSIITVYGNINLQLNRGANDSVAFFMWGGVINAYSDPIDVEGDIMVESLTYIPAKVVGIVLDDINEDYVKTSSWTNLDA